MNFGVGVWYGIGGNISYDYRIKNFNDHFALTLGGYIGGQRGDGYGSDYASPAGMGGKENYQYDHKWFFSPRGGCVYSFNDRFDIYAALMPGLLINKKYGSERKYDFYAGIAAGGRVALFKDVYLFTEIGYNILCYNLGLAYKF